MLLIASVLHLSCRGYLEVMLDRVFGESALHLNQKLAVAAAKGRRGVGPSL